MTISAATQICANGDCGKTLPQRLPGARGPRSEFCSKECARQQRASVSVRAETYEKLIEAAHARGCSVSALADQLIAAALKKRMGSA